MDVTYETPAPGLVIAQPRLGYRYSVDTFWLVGTALQALRDAGVALEGLRVLDLGTGSGLAAALLAAQGARALGIDVLPDWLPLWRETLARSTLDGRLDLVVADVLDGSWGPADLVVCNPPYFPAGTGPVAADPWRRIARTEGSAGLDDMVRAGLQALAPAGRLVLVVPDVRSDEVIAAAHHEGAVLTRGLRVDHTRWLGVLERDGTPGSTRQVQAQGAEVRAMVLAARRGVAR